MRAPRQLEDFGEQIPVVDHGAAKILGVDRTTLYRKLEEYKLKDEQ